MPKISVIMGVFNVGNGTKVEIAIRSILSQSFGDFEFIICDDGSEDNTYKIIEKIAEEDRRIKLIKNDNNQGLAQTLNNCLKISKGEYIARMDDDDFSYKDRFKKQVEVLDKNKNIDIVASSLDIYDGKKITHKQNIRVEYPEKEDFAWGTCFFHPSTMIRRKKLEEVNGYRVAKETRRAEDYDLFMRMYAMGCKGYNFKESLLRYYVNPEAMKKRKYIYRIDEAVVRYKGFKLLNLSRTKNIYILKPLIVGLIPKKLIFKIIKRIYKE
ncbi:glycosyltransferase family 2 protein [Clostridium thermobutyricum]|uniref:glycosyltransferase family 2 protein n=1 Tax=Clostridium thermobutyricum TaxID=29372 RepID=UPI0029435517|nr:glycosyltransferase family 2 protein [Clostridium thermobutyricum]